MLHSLVDALLVSGAKVEREAVPHGAADGQEVLVLLLVGAVRPGEARLRKLVEAHPQRLGEALERLQHVLDLEGSGRLRHVVGQRGVLVVDLDIPGTFQQPHAPTPIAAVESGPAAMRAELGELGASSGTAGLRIAVMTESRRREAPRSGAFEPNG